MGTQLHATAWRAPPPRPWAPAVVLAAHALLLATLWKAGVVQHTLHEATPLLVNIIAAPAPGPAPLVPRPAAPASPLPSAPALPVPPVALSTPPEPTAVSPAPAPVPVAATPMTAPSPDAAPAAALPALAAAAPPPAPAAPVHVAPGALRYLVEPPVQVPRLSRRLRESGTVLLQVVVDVRGLPRSVSLRQSSGHPRLDEQALSAMRLARFVPCTADGQPVECESVAPVVYELEPSP